MLLITAVLALSNRMLPTESAQPATLSESEKALLSETIQVRQQVGDAVWPGWETAVIPLIIYNEAYAFLLGYPDPPDGWINVSTNKPHGRLQEGRLPLSQEVISIDQFLSEMVLQAQTHAKNEGKHLFSQLPDSRLFIQIDIGLMTRVMNNLIDNALKYTPREGKVSVLVTESDAEETQIRVIDQGPGIPLEWRERVFQRFTQVSEPDRKSKAGTGLGLTFCRMVVEAHNGRIWIEDDPTGSGSQFIVSLPHILEPE